MAFNEVLAGRVRARRGERGADRALAAAGEDGPVPVVCPGQFLDVVDGTALLAAGCGSSSRPVEGTVGPPSSTASPASTTTATTQATTTPGSGKPSVVIGSAVCLRDGVGA